MGFYIFPNNQGRDNFNNDDIFSLGFFDPDGYFFDSEGFDQYGGYYDNDGYYHPGEGNKHEFPDYKAHDQNDRRGKQ
jgi:hypothetical protein